MTVCSAFYLFSSSSRWQSWRGVTASESSVAKTLTGATISQFISDPLKRQISVDVVNQEFDETSRRKHLEPLCTRMHMNGMFPPLCDGVGIAAAPEPPSPKQPH